MNPELLERPFAPEQIRQWKGRNGVLDYVEGHNVVQRLNEALAGAWSLEIRPSRDPGGGGAGHRAAHGGERVEMAFGGSQVTRDRESGAPPRSAMTSRRQRPTR